MSVELYVAKEFDTTYEREALSRFTKSMSSRFGEKHELYVILANYVIEGQHVDLTVIKKDAVLVIELKECKEEFTAYSNKDWRTASGKLIGQDGYNPSQQVDDYRKIWINFLKKYKNHFACLKNVKNTNKPFCYTKSYVAICPSLNKNYSNKISDENWWFRLCGLNDLDERISRETNEILNFSNDELRFIATGLLSMDKPRVIQITNTENLTEQIRNGIDGLTEIIEESKRKIVQLEQCLCEKNEVISELKSSNDQLTNALRQNSDMVEQMKLEKNDRDNEIQAADVKKFKMISEYVALNYYGGYHGGKMPKEARDKLNNLLKLSGKFNIDRKFAAEIITKAIQQANNDK